MSDAAETALRLADEPARGAGRREPPPLVARPFRPGDEAVLPGLFEEAFGYRRPLEVWRWRYGRSPGGDSFAVVLDADGAVVGHHGYIRNDVFVDGRRLSLVQAGDAMVAAGYRGRGGFSKLIDAFYSSGVRFDVRISYPNETALPRALHHNRSGATLGRVPSWTRRGELRRALPRPVRPLARGLVRANTFFAERALPPIPVVPLSEVGEDVDDLAAAAAGFARCIRVRDAAYVRWRWLDQPDAEWRVLGARMRDGRLGGTAVIGVTSDGRGRSGIVADLLARDEPTQRALLCAAADYLFACGCRSVECECLDPRPWARRAFLRAGFWPTATDTNVLAAAGATVQAGVVERRESWYLTHADAEPWRNEAF